MRVLACGNRDFNDHQIVQLVVDGLATTTREGNESLHLIHGDCRGADRLVADYVSVWPHSVVDAYPADWDKIGKAAGYARNQQMLREGEPTLVLAFIDKPLAECKGTGHMVTIAKDAGVPTYVIEKVA